MSYPSAIADFLACPHLTALERSASRGEIKKPFYADAGMDLLRELGRAHELKHFYHLTHELGLETVTIPAEDSAEAAAARTIEAMREGAAVIYQAAFLRGGWRGRADFLTRVERPSALGPWSYEVVEAKLARSTKVRALIQLSFYSSMVSEIQALEPEFMHVVLGGKTPRQKFQFKAYAAYFRKVVRDFEEAFHHDGQGYPEPVEHCCVCDWSTICEGVWRADDHLSLVAGITRNQRKALGARDVTTVAGLGALALPPNPKFERIGDRALVAIREQARLQVQGRTEGRHVYELLRPPQADRGLCSLPFPSDGDLFLDFEGDPYAFDDGLEYLFGFVVLGDDGKPVYRALWATDREAEKNAFEEFIDLVNERRRRYPEMHIYHYGIYEEVAMKHMAGRHATRIEELDQLLRAEVFVDLFRAVRQGLRASVESYSIKKMEPLYGFERNVQLVDANVALQAFQFALAFGPGDEDLIDVRRAIEGYNKDDCLSAFELRNWLEAKRQELEALTGDVLPRPAVSAGKASEELADRIAEVEALVTRLTADLPEAQEGWTEEQRARWLLAQMLDWHRREDKSAWWEYYRLCKLNDEQLQEEKAPLGGLELIGEVARVKKSIVYRYRYPLQDHAIGTRSGDPKARRRSGGDRRPRVNHRSQARPLLFKRAASARSYSS
jgi:predicted RecB family nuclease